MFLLQQSAKDYCTTPTREIKDLPVLVVQRMLANQRLRLFCPRRLVGYP